MASSDSEKSDSSPLSLMPRLHSSNADASAQFRTPSPTFLSDLSGRTRTDFNAERSNAAELDFEFDDPDDRNDMPPTSYIPGEINSHSEFSRRSEHRSSGMELGRHVQSTPRTATATRRDVTQQTQKEYRKHLTKALGVVTEADPDYVKVKIVVPQTNRFSGRSVRKWLNEQATALGIVDPDTGSFILPEKPTWESQLYDYFMDIISATLGEFVVPNGTTVEREVVNMHKVKLPHFEGQHKTSPDLVVRATGSSFENPAVGIAGYSNMATFIEVKLDTEINKTVHLEQMAGYVQQIFAYQPNRLFVRCLLLSEKRIRLVQFDRAGAEKAPFIDLPRNPDLLVRLIIALCSTDEEELGFDTSIQWTIVNGKKTSGKMKTFGPDREEKVHELVEQHPVTQDYDIRGRGTTIWKVWDPVEKELLFVKQSWTSEGRPHEHLHLMRAKGIDGVCQIVGYEVLQEIRQFRCANTAFANRIGIRIIMKIYGKQVDKFNNVLQALRAIRDAVAAHEKLWLKKILHRDITNKNILLGREDATKGWYGVLIDLGVALDFEDGSNSNVTKEARSGSRFFQSCAILEHLTRLCGSVAPAHDYLDDLECFFYVLCFLFFLFLPDGTKRGKDDVAKEVVKDWDSERAEHALGPKSVLFNPARSHKYEATRIVTQTWGSACGNLFKSFAEWIWGIQMKKGELLIEYKSRLESNPENQQDQQSRVSQNPAVRGAFATLLLDSERHYAEVLAFFDIAIAAIETSPDNGVPPHAHEKRNISESDPTANSGPSKVSRTGSTSEASRSLQG